MNPESLRRRRGASLMISSLGSSRPPGPRVHGLCLLLSSANLVLLITFCLMPPSSWPPSRVFVLAAWGLFYVLYWVETMLSRTRRILGKIANAPKVVDLVAALRRAPPAVRFGVTCWHFDNDRSNDSAHLAQNSHGPTFISRRLFRVNSYHQEEYLLFKSWQDATTCVIGGASQLEEILPAAPVPGPSSRFSCPFRISELRIVSRDFHYVDYDTEQHAQNQINSLKELHHSKDEFLDFSSSLDLSGFPLRDDSVLLCFDPPVNDDLELQRHINEDNNEFRTIQVPSEPSSMSGAEAPPASFFHHKYFHGAGELPNPLLEGRPTESDSGVPKTRLSSMFAWTSRLMSSKTPARVPSSTDSVPALFSVVWFLVASCFLLSWPFRLLVDAQSGTIDCHVRKVLCVHNGLATSDLDDDDVCYYNNSRRKSMREATSTDGAQRMFSMGQANDDVFE